MGFENLIRSGMLACLAFASAVSAQSLEEFKARYPNTGVFQVRPNVLMTPYYTSRGILCGVFLQANRFPSPPHSISVGTISPDDVLGISQELEPNNPTNKIGHAFYYKQSTNMSIAKFSFDDFYLYLTKSGLPDLTVPASDRTGKKQQVTSSTLPDFLRSFGDADVAEVWWNKRDGCHDRQ